MFVEDRHKDVSAPADGFHLHIDRHALEGFPIEPSIETLSPVHARTSGARGSKGFLPLGRAAASPRMTATGTVLCSAAVDHVSIGSCNAARAASLCGYMYSFENPEASRVFSKLKDHT